MTNNYFIQKQLPDYRTLCDRRKNLGLSAYTSNHMPEWVRCSCVFHVMIYGSHISKLISSRAEAEAFMRKMAEGNRKFGTSVLHYAVMNNHIHLVIYGENWKAVSGNVRSATMSLAKGLRKKYNVTEAVYSKPILYSVCNTSGTLLKVMRYLTENAKESAHTCYLSAVNEYMYENFVFADFAKTCELIGRDISTVSHLMVSAPEEFSRFMGDYFIESERSVAKFLPKGMYI